MERKEKNVPEGVVTRKMTEVDVADSDVAPVCGISLSIVRDTHEGRDEEDETGKQPRTYP